MRFSSKLQANLLAADRFSHGRLHKSSGGNDLTNRFVLWESRWSIVKNLKKDFGHDSSLISRLPATKSEKYLIVWAFLERVRQCQVWPARPQSTLTPLFGQLHVYSSFFRTGDLLVRYYMQGLSREPMDDFPLTQLSRDTTELRGSWGLKFCEK